eukprot:3452039-Prymnesium_polylepis.2
MTQPLLQHLAAHPGNMHKLIAGCRFRQNRGDSLMQVERSQPRDDIPAITAAGSAARPSGCGHGAYLGCDPHSACQRWHSFAEEMLSRRHTGLFRLLA